MNDILLDGNNDLLVMDGDFVVGFSDQQNQKLLLLAEKGSFKQYPDLGVGLFSFLENEDVAGLVSEIRRQFTLDGMVINKLNIKGDGKFDIDAEY